MARKISSAAIKHLQAQTKILARPLKSKWIIDRKFRRLTIELISQNNSKERFNVYMRQSTIREFDFSCGISLIVDSENDITLARYNGSSHVHVNKIDGQRFDFECHIHMATEDCLKLSKKIENFAIATDRYTDIAGAIRCLVEDYNIIGLSEDQFLEQGGLFDEL